MRPRPNRTAPVQRIEVPVRYEDFERTLRTGVLLFVKNHAVTVSHVVLRVGKLGHSRDGTPLILDRTGPGALDSEGHEIPDGIQLRPCQRNSWYTRGILTRDSILQAVWGNAVLVTTRSVDRCVTTLRAKVEPDPHHPTYIHTIREIGYRFCPTPSP